MKKHVARPGRWDDPETWDPPGVPEANDHLVLDGRSVRLPSGTYAVRSNGGRFRAQNMSVPAGTEVE